MRLVLSFTIIAPLMLATACESGGSSSEEVRQAAIDRARQELGVAADAPLEAEVWAGQEHDGQQTVCGTVSGGEGSEVTPQRFAATTDPIEWLLFEEAHDPMVPVDPNMFPEWSRLCGAGAQS